MRAQIAVASLPQIADNERMDTPKSLAFVNEFAKRIDSMAADPAQEESLGHEPDGRGDGDPDRDRRDEVPRDPHRDDARVTA